MTGASLRVLHLVGSGRSAFFADLSQVYAREVFAPPGTEASYACVEPGGAWRLGGSLDALGPARPCAEALAALPEVDVVVPHMFDAPGMVAFRALFEDVLGIPVVGPTPATNALSMAKGWTASVLREAGVCVPEGRTMPQGAAPPDMALPLVVKPDRGDNSVGLALVRDPANLARALQDAWNADPGEPPAARVESFIPGRELRLCVVETVDGPIVPAVMEYPLEPDAPIRTVTEKLQLKGGRVEGQSTRARPTLPAALSPAQRRACEVAALAAHRALGARDYSLFDLRLEAGTDRPVFLEAGLFWAFARNSMVSRMLEASGRSAEADALWLWRRAALRRGC